MKKCPSCNQLFSEDNYFCLEDGTTLLFASETGAYPPVSPTADDIPTQVIPRPQVTAQIPVQIAPKDTSKWLFLIIGVLATAVVGMGVFMFAKRGEEKPVANQNTAENANRAENMVAKNINAPKVNQTIEEPKINQNLSPAGNWSGDWHSWGSYRTSFTAQMDLTDNGAGKLSGQIIWTLQSSNNPKKIGKVGSSATEYVQGVYNPATRSVSLQGVRIDDPNGIVIKDRYSLILAENNLTMNGKSKGGNFVLKR